MKIKHRVITRYWLKLVLKYLMDSGIRSVIDMQIITPDANAHAEEIILSLFLILKKMGIIPIRVDNPAKEVRISGYNIN